MRVERIPNPKNGGSFVVMQSGDVEFQNPIDHFHNVMVRMNYELDLTILLSKKLPYPPVLYHSILRKKTQADWEEEYQRIRNINLHDELHQLANADSKKSQIQMLKNISFESDELLAYTYMVWEKY